MTNYNCYIKGCNPEQSFMTYGKNFNYYIDSQFSANNIDEIVKELRAIGYMICDEVINSITSGINLLVNKPDWKNRYNKRQWSVTLKNNSGNPILLISEQ